MNNLLADIKYSLRMLTKNPLFTFIAVLTLALGIGLNAATFSAIDSLLLKPLPGTEAPEELVQIYRQWPGMDFGSSSIPHYQDIRDASGDVFESTAAWFFTQIAITVDGNTERTMASSASANFFQTYGVTPQLGRGFLPGVEDSGPGAHPVVVLGHSYWQTRFGGDRGIVGRSIGINGMPYEVVGVAPESFRGPMVGIDMPLWVPIMMQPQLEPGSNRIEQRGNNMMNVIARLRPGKTIDDASTFLDTWLIQMREEYPDHYDRQLGHTVVLQSEAGMHPNFRNAQVGLSSVIMGVVSLLLLIACVNVANLFLARARERRREMGMRLSLGASRGRIVRQLLTESVVFSLVAGGAGVLLARLATRFLSGIKPPIDGPFSFDFVVDNRVLFFTLLVSVAAGVLFGLAPALHSIRRDTLSAVKGASSSSPGRSRTSRALVVAQMALSLVLLVASSLFLRSLQGATRIDPGFADPAHLVTASVSPGLLGYDQPRAREFFDRLVEEVEALPDVTTAGLTTTVPLGLSGSDRGVRIPGYEFSEGERTSLHYSMITEGYFETMGIELLEGRLFTRQDDESSAPMIIVNKRFADRFWPGESALGKIVSTAGEDREVIGVVQNGKYRSLGEEPLEYMFFPHREIFSYDMALVARTRTDPNAVLNQIRQTVRTLDAEMPVFDVRTFEDHMGLVLLPARLGGFVLGMFGVLGLVLAAVGIYGVMAYSVAQRQRELGLRVALGANRGSVVSQVLGEGLKLALVGTAIGLVGAVLVARAVRSLLYDTNAFDPMTFGLVPLVLVAVAALAVYFPARRASGVDPMRVLKVE